MSLLRQQLRFLEQTMSHMEVSYGRLEAIYNQKVAEGVVGLEDLQEMLVKMREQNTEFRKELDECKAKVAKVSNALRKPR